LLDPNSNLPGLREPIRPLFLAGEKALERNAAQHPHFAGFADAFELHGRALAREGWLHEDFASPGLLVPMLALAGFALVAWHRRENRPLFLVLCGLGLHVLLFALTTAALQAWTAHKLRYFVLVGPPLAIAAVLPFRSSGRGVRLGFWVSAAALASMALTVLATSRSAGLRAILDADHVPGARENRMREAAIDRLGSERRRVGFALPFNSRSAPFLRRPAGHTTVRFDPDDVRRAGTFEDFLRVNELAALVVDLDAVSLPPGRVEASWAAPDAAVALLVPGTSDTHTVGLCSDAEGLDANGRTGGRTTFRVHLVSNGHLSLGVHNASTTEQTLIASSSQDRWVGRLAPGELTTVGLPVSSPDTIRLEVGPTSRPGRGLRLLLPSGMSCSDTPRAGFARMARQRGV